MQALLHLLAGALLAFSLSAQLTVGNVTFPRGSQLSAITWENRPAVLCLWAPPAAPFVTITTGVPGQRVQLELDAVGFLHPAGYPGPIACITRLDRGIPGGVWPVGFWALANVGNPAFYPYGAYQPLWEEGVYNVGYGLPLFPPILCPLTTGGTAQRPDVAGFIFRPTLW